MPKNSAYTGAGTGRRAASWYAPVTGPTRQLQADLPKLISRSRAAIRNDPWASSGLEKLVSNVVGRGITPKSLAQDDGLRELLQDLFLQWSEVSDPDGVLSFYGQQSIAARSMFEAGECFVRMRNRRPEDNLIVPLQLQIVEAEYVPLHYNDTISSGKHYQGRY